MVIKLNELKILLLASTYIKFENVVISKSSIEER